MTDERDARIAAFLRAEAPPARDPLFRIKVMERREQRQFQRQAVTMLAGALMIALLATFGVREVGGGALVAGAALATVYLAFRGRPMRIFRRFGGYMAGTP